MTTVAGVAYFDDPSSLSGGWCSVNGEKAIRFNSPAELDPQVIWITNTSIQDYNNNQLSYTSHIRNTNFFRQSLSAIASEIDIEPSAPIPTIIETLSGVSARVIGLAYEVFPGIRLGLSLADSIYEHLQLADQRNDPAGRYQPQFQSAFQENSLVAGVKWVPGAENVRLVPNRVSYAELLLSYPVPIGGLREVSEAMAVEQFLALDHPAIAQAEVDLSSSENPELLAFGVQMSGTAIMREWMTQPEMHFMHISGAKIKLHRVIRSESSDVLPPMLEKISSNAFVRCSYSAGLLAESLSFALMSKRYMRGSRTAKTKYFFPGRAIHMRSVDRMLSFSVAKRLADLGFRVKSYGFGGVTINATKEEVPEIMNVGADMGFMLLAVNTLGRDGE